MLKRSPVRIVAFNISDSMLTLTPTADTHEESPALANALKAFAILTREQKAALSRALDGFVDCLASAANPNPHARTIATENAWHNRVNWNEDEWTTWETWGWYRHFCRMVSELASS